MVTSVLELYNLAVTRVGHEPMSSETESGKAGRLCRLHYPTIRDATLMSHPWNFAMRRAALSSIATSPAFEFDYAYVLPTEPKCLKVVRTDWEATGFTSTSVYGYPGIHGYSGVPIEYRIETIDHGGTPLRVLLCNEASCKIEFIAQITDVSLFSPLFVDTLAARLAAELAFPLTDNQSAVKTMMDLYQMKMAEARVVDAQQGTPRDVVNTDGWLVARQ